MTRGEDKDFITIRSACVLTLSVVIYATGRSQEPIKINKIFDIF